MYRATVRNDASEWTINKTMRTGYNCEDLCEDHERDCCTCQFEVAVSLLAAYEDTGLSPEEVRGW